ncbi:epoxyqueuosine reductase QueH [Candidatus Omnitrophota bacterium]
MSTKNKDKKVLLHICCAVCATACVERLKKDGFAVVGYFYNPNIYPEPEYRQRLAETKRLAEALNFPLIVGKYLPDYWLRQIQGWEHQPEGGRRCIECFRLRLVQLKKTAQTKRIAYFTTTLTISPHKDEVMINEIGANIDREQFLVRDFKKKNGFKRAQKLGEKYDLYHQNYCGCQYSKKDSV